MPKLTAKARKELPKESFALPEERMFPIHDADHIKLAWGMLKKAKSLTDDQRKAAGNAIVKAAKAAKIDTTDWKLKPVAETKGDDADLDEMDLPAAEDLTVATIGAMTEPEELCAAWCLTHDMPLTSVERAALQAAVMARCSDLNISMYSWDYYDGGKLAEMHEQTSGTEADAAKGAPTLEAIGAMESMEELRKAYVDIREASLSAEVREGLEAAVRGRTDTLGIDWWTWRQKITEQALEGAEGSAADSAAGDSRFLFDSAGDCEVFLGPSFLLDEGDPAAGRPMRRRWRVSRADFINDNRRLYTLDLIQDAVRQANADIAAGCLDAGEMYHPKAYRAVSGKVMFESAFERQVFKWERFHVAEDGTVYGDAQILGHTPAGAIIEGHVRSGVTVPVSVRWMIPNGSTIRTLADGSKVEVPNKPLRIRTVDAVPNPAMGDAVDIQALDSAQINVILAAPTAPAEGAAVVSAPAANNPSTNDSGAQGAQREEQHVTKEEMQAYMATDEGQAMLKKAAGGDKADDMFREFQADKAERARKVAVQAVVDAADFSKIDAATRGTITDAVSQAPDAAQAQVILDAQMTLANTYEAKIHAGKLGYDSGANRGTVRVDVTDGGQPWRQAVDSLKVSFDAAARSQGNLPDNSLRKLNAPIVAKMIAKYEQQNGRALADAVQSMQDGAFVIADSGRLAIADAATTTALVLNQPLVQMAIIEQAFQDVEALQFATVRTDAEGGVFKVPSEYYTPAADASTGDLISAESTAIAEGNVNLAWLTFSPDWRRIATRISQDVIRELKAGPANYDTLGRSLYHIPREKGRVVDLAIYREMLVTSDEYSAVSMVDEAQTAPVAGAGGTNVSYVYSLRRGTNTYAPVVRPRQVTDLNSGGNKTTTIKNQLTVKLSGATKVRGYLDSLGNIQPATADYAVVWESGKVYCKTGLAITPGTTDIVASYTYATNFDKFDLTVPNGLTPEQYYNRMLFQVDQTAALMGSAPRYKKPSVAIMSLNAATYFQNASIFYQLNSPKGTELLADGTYFGNRNGVNLARINAPWDAGDNRMLFTQIGATQYGVDTPFEIEGPEQAYTVDLTTGEARVKDEKIWFGREHSAIFTPQPTDIAGKVMNPFLRSLVLFKS